MKITHIRLRQLQGTMKSALVREERPAAPRDIYPAFRHLNPPRRQPTESAEPGETGQLTQTFVQIDTDEGVRGIAGPLSGDATALYIDRQLKPLLLGQDPFRTEYLWDVMYRTAANGRVGENMIAISSVDVALWDIKGKLLRQPVVRLLGGPVQERLPVYASTARYSLAGYAELTRRSPIPIAGGEHEFTRWSFKALMDRKAMNVYQPEPMWAGGVSEMVKIGALATAYGVKLLYHVYYPVASAHVSFALNPLTTPMGEYLYNVADEYQYFLKRPLKPINGFFYPPEAPGMGMDIDEQKIEAEREVSF